MIENTYLIFLVIFLSTSIFPIAFLLGNNLFASLCFYIYKFLNKKDANLTKNPRLFWDRPYTLLAKYWVLLGRILHGYEIVNIENVPNKGPALLIMYHATTPIDAGFFISKFFIEKKRKVLAVVDRIAYKIPGYLSFLEALEHESGTIETCLNTLKRGDLLIIYPGGVHEAVFSDSSYKLCWREKAGFSKLAAESKCPIIPVFTQNCREVIGTVKLFKMDFFKNSFLQQLIFGYFPVKLRSYVGKQIQYDEYKSMTNEEIVKLTKTSLETLIRQHQRIPGSKLLSLLDRFDT